jgi:hypothetical protein
LDHQLKINKSMVRAKFSKRTPDKDWTILTTLLSMISNFTSYQMRIFYY